MKKSIDFKPGDIWWSANACYYMVISVSEFELYTYSFLTGRFLNFSRDGTSDLIMDGAWGKL